MSWFLWLCLVALLVLPVFAVLVEDRPPPNEITDEQDPRDPATNRDGDAEMASV